jgi:hypothetical protein
MPAWNICKVDKDPIDGESAPRIADLVLDHRIAAAETRLDRGEPFELFFSTRSNVMKKSEWVLAANLTHRFEGRLARPQSWGPTCSSGISFDSAHIAKASGGSIYSLLGTNMPAGSGGLGRRIPVSLRRAGQLAARLDDFWWRAGSLGSEAWGLNVPSAPTNFTAQSVPANVNATELALVVSVTEILADVRSFFQGAFSFRALVHSYDPCPKAGRRLFLSGAEAVQVAHLAACALREAWKTYKVRGTVHLFLAVPAGLAFMIGQLLNGFGGVQTYEHVPTQQHCYLPAALLRPSI